MIVVVRIDLDKYSLDHIATLYVNELLTLGELSEAKVVKDMSELDRLRWVRKLQRERELLKVTADTSEQQLQEIRRYKAC